MNLVKMTLFKKLCYFSNHKNQKPVNLLWNCVFEYKNFFFFLLFEKYFIWKLLWVYNLILVFFCKYFDFDCLKVVWSCKNSPSFFRFCRVILVFEWTPKVRIAIFISIWIWSDWYVKGIIRSIKSKICSNWWI